MPTISRAILTVDGSEGRIGRDPREMSEADFNAAGIFSSPVLAAIRAKCLDCSGESPSEVARCTAVACALWPFRMNKNPFRIKSDAEPTEAQLAARAANGERLREMAAKRRGID